jgi:hypothetical protein
MSKDYERLPESSEAFVYLSLPNNGVPDGEAIGPLVRLFGRFLTHQLPLRDCILASAVAQR